MPYLDMGEFYSEYASYKVNITVPSGMVVGATGELQNADELAAYKSVGTYNKITAQAIRACINSALKENKKLTYIVDSVPDFAWFADASFVVEYDTLQLPSGKVIDAFTYHHNKKKYSLG